MANCIDIFPYRYAVPPDGLASTFSISDNAFDFYENFVNLVYPYNNHYVYLFKFCYVINRYNTWTH